MKTDKPTDERPITKKSDLWLYWILISLATLITYSNSFQTELIFDSKAVVTQDPRLKDWNPENLKEIILDDYWFGKESTLYRPITTISYAIQYSLIGHGDSPTPYHVVNFLIHISVASLLLVLLRGTGIPPFVAACFTLLYSIHPVHVEAVTNIVGRADLLAALGVLIAVIGHRRSIQSGTGSIQIGSLGLVTFGSFLALGSKEPGITVIGVLLAHDWLFPHEIESKHTSPLKVRWRTPARMINYASVLLVAGLWFLLRHQALSDGNDPMSPADNPLLILDQPWSFLTAATVLVRYLWLIVCPIKLSADYSFNAIPLIDGTANGLSIIWGLIAVFALSIMVLVSWLLRKRAPTAAFFLLFFFITISPTANIFITVGTIMAERLLYLPSIGLFGMLACLAPSIASDASRRKVFYSLALVVALAFGTRTWIRNADWADAGALFASAVQVVPDSFKANNSHAAHIWLAAEKENNTEAVIDEVILYSERSVDILRELPEKSWSSRAFANLGEFYIAKSEQVEDEERDIWRKRALELYQSTLAAEDRINLKREGPETRNFRLHARAGELLIEQGRTSEGLMRLETALRIRPSIESLLEAARAYRESMNFDRATILALMALSLDQSAPDIWVELDANLKSLQLAFAAPLLPNGQRTIHVDTPGLRERVDSACTELYHMLLKLDRDGAFAEQYRHNAIHGFGCPPTMFEQ